jgi:hypothetical protein
MDNEKIPVAAQIEEVKEVNKEPIPSQKQLTQIQVKKLKPEP